jgi:N-acetylmuramic acid 6-phosphate etherase
LHLSRIGLFLSSILKTQSIAVDDLSKLQTEGRNSRTTNIDTLPTLELCRVINEEDATVAKSVEQCLPIIAAAIGATAPRIRRGGKLIYVGAGTSAR